MDDFRTAAAALSEIVRSGCDAVDRLVDFLAKEAD